MAALTETAEAEGGRQRGGENRVTAGPGTRAFEARNMTFPGRGAAFPCRREAWSSWRREASSARRREASSGLCCSAEQGEAKHLFGRDEPESPRNRRFFPVYQKLPSGAITMRGARRIPIAKTFTPQNWLASNGYLTSCRTRRRRQQLFCVDLRGRDAFDADDDPAAGIRHSHQHHPDRLGDSDPQLSDANAAHGVAAAQHLPATPDVAVGARREEIGQQRSVDGMAQAVHDRAQMRGRRGAVLQR